jgi:hypothetical protein
MCIQIKFGKVDAQQQQNIDASSLEELGVISVKIGAFSVARNVFMGVLKNALLFLSKRYFFHRNIFSEIFVIKIQVFLPDPRKLTISLGVNLDSMNPGP